MPTASLVCGSCIARSQKTCTRPRLSVASRCSSSVYGVGVAVSCSGAGRAFSLPGVLLPRTNPQPGWWPPGFLVGMPARVRIVHAVALQFSPSDDDSHGGESEALLRQVGIVAPELPRYDALVGHLHAVYDVGGLYQRIQFLFRSRAFEHGH